MTVRRYILDVGHGEHGGNGRGLTRDSQSRRGYSRAGTSPRPAFQGPSALPVWTRGQISTGRTNLVMVGHGLAGA